MDVNKLVMVGFAALVGLGPLSILPSRALAGPTERACESRVNDTAAKLVECIRKDALWDHLVEFQRIADQNPGPDGHPSRNGGEPGYKASVDYVAKRMTEAGYKVTIQTFTDPYFSVEGTPRFSAHAWHKDRFALRRDWYVAYNSGAGRVSAALQPVGEIVVPATSDSTSGCSASDFTNFVAGHVALIQRGYCDYGTKVANAINAGAVAVVLFNSGNSPDTLSVPDVFLYPAATIPVIISSYDVGADLYQRYIAQKAPVVDIDVKTIVDPNRLDYNVIADSPFGDPNHVVVVDAHLDAIFGAGILDNASGSATILEVARKMARTPTRNQLRFIWFGGEEIGLYGSLNYLYALDSADLARIVFDVDVDVTATPNFVNWIADPNFSYDSAYFPPNVLTGSALGNGYFTQYFASIGVPVRSAPFGNDGTDSNSFSYFGVPNTGILTGQDCCKAAADVSVFGGFTGNFEGHIPSFDGGCVDYEGRWCDDWYNNDPHVLEVISKAVGYVTFNLANDATLNPAVLSPDIVRDMKTAIANRPEVSRKPTHRRNRLK